ncbi:MAG: hypothetical protein ACYC0V_11965 [Armatimonadota bacterium]
MSLTRSLRPSTLSDRVAIVSKGRRWLGVFDSSLRYIRYGGHSGFDGPGSSVFKHYPI